eukprot:6164687-Pyramimonas_sp.AAC.1
MEQELCDALGIEARERSLCCGRGTKLQAVEKPILEQHVKGQFPKCSLESRAPRRFHVWLEELSYLHGLEHPW